MADDEYREPDIGALRLDPENPRLPRNMPEEDRTPEGLLRHFARTYNLIELTRSMADKGFAPKQAEALLVVEDPPESGGYVVVEGNRRLATMMLFRDIDARKEFGLSPEWETLAAEAGEKGFNFDSVPVIVYESKESLDEYLGFRHITGPTEWRPEAKARFIARLLRAGRSIDDVWRRIGSNSYTVKRYAEAHAVYEQMLELGIDVQPVEAKFGVFYNALATEGVRSYLGLSPQRDFVDLPHEPIAADRFDQLTVFVNLLYGDEKKDLKGVLRESRELKELSAVLVDPQATQILVDTRDLLHAYRVAGGGKTELLVLLKDSFARLVEANGQSYEFKDDSDVRVAVRRLVELMKDMADRYEIGREE